MWAHPPGVLVFVSQNTVHCHLLYEIFPDLLGSACVAPPGGPLVGRLTLSRDLNEKSKYASSERAGAVPAGRRRKARAGDICSGWSKGAGAREARALHP